MLRILLVEDNKADARLTAEMLKDSGLDHEIVWADDGKKALAHIESEANFDLFILDLNLPKSSGLDILKHLRKVEKFQKTPVIMMTGSTSPENTLMIKADDSLYYLVKPMTLEEIDRTVLAIKAIVPR